MNVVGRRLAETFSVLADKAFPLCPEILTPYKGGKENPLTEEEKNFNLQHELQAARYTLQYHCTLNMVKKFHTAAPPTQIPFFIIADGRTGFFFA